MGASANNQPSTTPPYLFVSAEGLPQLSTDGTSVGFSCYRGILAGQVIPDASTTLRTLGRLLADGAFDVSTYTYEGYSGTATSPAGIFGVLPTASSTYYFFGPGYAVNTGFFSGGLHFVSFGTAITSSYANGVVLPYWVTDPGVRARAE